MSTDIAIPSEQSLILTFYRHHLWSNLRLCDSCLELSDEQLNHSDAGTFGSIWATLIHLVRSEEYYLFRLTGRKRPEDEADAEIPIAELKERARQNGALLMETAMTIEPGTYVDIGDEGESELIPAEILLLQAVHHAHEHRTQICTLMGQQGIQPPALSGWSYYFEELSSNNDL